MNQEYPSWASKKQLEGMELFIGIAKEYGDFNISFKESQLCDADDSTFDVDIKWEHHTATGLRKHEMTVSFDYERTWNSMNERIHEWQFVFSGGEATREISTEVFFLDMFFYLDGKANLAA